MPANDTRDEYCVPVNLGIRTLNGVHFNYIPDSYQSWRNDFTTNLYNDWNSFVDESKSEKKIGKMLNEDFYDFIELVKYHFIMREFGLV